MRKTPKKAIHPLAYEHDTVLQAIGGVFSAKPTFVRATRGKPAIGDGGFSPRFAASLLEKKPLRRKKLRLLQTGQYCVRRPVGELPF